MQSWHFDAGWRLINLSAQKPLCRVRLVTPSGHQVAEEHKEQLHPLTGSASLPAQMMMGSLLFCPCYERYAKSSGNRPKPNKWKCLLSDCEAAVTHSSPCKCPSVENDELKSFGIWKCTVTFIAVHANIDALRWETKINAAVDTKHSFRRKVEMKVEMHVDRKYMKERDGAVSICSSSITFIFWFG